MPEVIVVGAGPVGLTLAAQLGIRGVDVLLLEQRVDRGRHSRAIGIHAPVLAALEPSGHVDRILASAVRVHRGEARDGAGRLLGSVRFDRLPARFPFVATLPQPLTEEALGVGAPAPLRGVTVREVRPTGDRVRVRAVSDDGEREWTAAIVVVATGSGGRHLVYRPGAVAVRHYPDRYVMADLDVDPRADADADVAVVTLAPGGVLESFPLPGGRRRFVAWDGRGDDPAPHDAARRLQRAIAERGRRPVEVDASASTFRVRRVVVPRLRRDRIVVVGDGAHEVSPIGGQGMNLGLLDAVGLAPLLAQWVHTGTAPAAELDAWERRRVRSARIAAGLATVNTALGRPALGRPALGRPALGRPAPPLRDAARSALLRLMLAGPSGTLFAHAYAMGFDRDASTVRRPK